MLTVFLGLATPLSGTADAVLPSVPRVARSVAYLDLPPPVPLPGVPGTTGSGFVVASNASASYIVTAAHVLNCDTYGTSCHDRILVQAGGSANRVDGDLVFAGAANETEDYAIVRVPVGGLPAVALGTARANERVGLLGYPASSGKVELISAGGLITNLNHDDNELVMNFPTSPGDSGGPIFDAATGAALGIVHGLSEGQGLAVATAAVHRALAQAAEGAQSRGAATADERLQAALRYEYAKAAEDRCAELASVVPGTFAKVNELCALARRLLIAAVEAGSFDAAIEIVKREHDAEFNALKDKDAVLARVEQAAATGDDTAVLAFISHFDADVQNAKTNPTAAASATANIFRTVNAAANGGDPVSMVLFALFYDQAAHGNASAAANSLFGAFDPSWDLGPEKDQAAAADWANRAAAPLKARVDAGDSLAAFIAAVQFANAPEGKDPENAAATLGNYLTAIALGSDAALNNLPNIVPEGTMKRQLFLALKHAFDNGKRGQYAISLGMMYEEGDGTPVDKHQALLAYRAAGFNPLSARLPALVPEGSEIDATLAATPGYQAALASLVRITVPAARGSPGQVSGVVVQSGGGEVLIATAAFDLGCDSWAKGCQPATQVEFASGATSTNVRLVRPADTSLENGIALLRVDGVNASAATVATAIPDLVVTACGSEPRWGVVLDASQDRRVLDLAVPFSNSGYSSIGCGLFDLRSGKIVGMYTDPAFVFGATGPATIAKALREVHAP